jgi:hypothetical protein
MATKRAQLSNIVRKTLLRRIMPRLGRTADEHALTPP